MSDHLRLNILSPERRLVEKAQVEWVTLPGSEGQLQILPGHAALMGTLETGMFAFRLTSGGESSGALSTGFFEVLNNEVSVMAETVELRNEIDVNRAQRAQANAETKLQEPDLDEASFRKYQLKLQRALIRQQTAASHTA